MKSISKELADKRVMRTKEDLILNASDKSQYLFFDIIEKKPKTVVIRIKSKRHGDILGYIRWYGKWRQYVFEPSEETIFNTICLHEIQSLIHALMMERVTEAIIPN